MNCGGDRGTIRVEIWHRLKDPVQTDRMGAPPLRPQGAEPAGRRARRRRAARRSRAGRGPIRPAAGSETGRRKDDG